MNIKEAQLSALSRINYCFLELKNNPPMQMINSYLDSNSLSNTMDNYMNYSIEKRKEIAKELYNYLKRESTTEARIMLIINYLSALLNDKRNNRICIQRNCKKEDYDDFIKSNSDTINKIVILRDKLYSHTDLDLYDYIKDLSFDEIEKCILFLNDLLDYDFDCLVRYNDIKQHI